jgi:hypothetical protein
LANFSQQPKLDKLNEETLYKAAQKMALPQKNGVTTAASAKTYKEKLHERQNSATMMRKLYK